MRGWRPWPCSAVLAAWAWSPRPAPPLEPPLPEGIQEEELRQAIEKARRRSRPSRIEPGLGTPGAGAARAPVRQGGGGLLRGGVAAGPLPSPALAARAGLVALHQNERPLPALFRQAAEAAGDDEPAWRLCLAEAWCRWTAATRPRQDPRRAPEASASAQAALGLGRLVRKASNRRRRANCWETPAKPMRQGGHGQLAALARAAGEHQRHSQLEAEAAGLEADAAWPDPVMDLTSRMVVGERGKHAYINALEQEGRFEEAAALHPEQGAAAAAEDFSRAAFNLARLGDFEQAIPLARQAVRARSRPCGGQLHAGAGAVRRRTASGGEAKPTGAWPGSSPRS